MTKQANDRKKSGHIARSGDDEKALPPLSDSKLTKKGRQITSSLKPLPKIIRDYTLGQYLNFRSLERPVKALLKGLQGVRAISFRENVSELLLKLRPHTIAHDVLSRMLFINSAVITKHRIHPANPDVSLPFRYTQDGSLVQDGSDREKLYRIVIERGVSSKIDPHDAESLQLVDTTPLKKNLIHTGEAYVARFRAENGGEYEIDNTLEVTAENGEKIYIHQLKSCNSKERTRVLPLAEQPQDVTIRTKVALSYQNLVAPQFNRRIDNKQANGGINAYNCLKNSLVELLNGLVNEGLYAPEDVEAYIKTYVEQNIPTEYIHAVAGHWGLVMTLDGKIVDPADIDATFAGPAVFNTEMLLFERFADYLLFINHRKHGMGYTVPTVHYECNITYDKVSGLPNKVQMKITDLVSGYTFEQTFKKPLNHTARPSAQLFRYCIRTLKDIVRGTLMTKEVGTSSSGTVMLRYPDHQFRAPTEDTPLKPRLKSETSMASDNESASETTSSSGTETLSQAGTEPAISSQPGEQTSESKSRKRLIDF